jgi:hypothetical protein
MAAGHLSELKVLAATPDQDKSFDTLHTDATNDGLPGPPLSECMKNDVIGSIMLKMKASLVPITGLQRKQFQAQSAQPSTVKVNDLMGQEALEGIRIKGRAILLEALAGGREGRECSITILYNNTLGKAILF